jgi:hypothetical protein
MAGRTRIEFEQSGGFAGMTLSTTVDTARLPPDEAREIEQLVDQADLTALPSRPAGPPRGADRFQYDITVVRGRKRHHVTIQESDMPPAVRPLVQRLAELARRR